MAIGMPKMLYIATQYQLYMYLYRNIHCRDFIFLNRVNLNLYFIKCAYRSPRQHGGSSSSHRLHSRWIIWLGFQSSIRRIRTGILRKCRRRHPQLSTRRFRYYWFYPNNKLFKYQLIESTLKRIFKIDEMMKLIYERLFWQIKSTVNI